MRKKRHTPEEIVRELREVEVVLAQGQSAVQVHSQPSQFLLAVALVGILCTRRKLKF